ncbi:DUF4745 domain-containing protein [Trichonephila inaurata madagascariensis]|uniref:DUF4745 domain-containing protein n=1 Tax=Trichonephila inaurata madagascariensis TaxID=2747483 RepID=A0A8X6XFT8_9ARAC|nr:DUF4745 domain-containing protein [Trichonephila inaurata madagascariensis]
MKSELNDAERSKGNSVHFKCFMSINNRSFDHLKEFGVSTKISVNQEREMPFPLSSAGKPIYRQFDKNTFMNDICNCLDLCCSYIQALNSVCDAGSSLARNLFNAVREVPTFHNVSLQFLSVWEEVSKATAGASAAVKTETLMMLQEILNSLEIGKNETDMEEKMAESFQVIGTCLCSFIELQAQFSLSTWKSFSKLSKHFTSDSVRHSLQWKSLERTPSKIVVNTDLNATIKKHFSQLFSKVGISKINEPSENNLSHFCSPSHRNTGNISIYSPFGNQGMTEGAVENSVWPSSNAVWSSCNSSNITFPEETQTNEQVSQSASCRSSDLDEVINLLSCVPVQQAGNMQNDQNQNYFNHHSTNQQMYHILPKASLHLSKGLNNHRSWAKESRDISIGYDSWLWRIDNMNCSGLPSNSDALKLSQRSNDIPFQWDNQELQKWNTSLCETGSSSDDGSSVHGLDSECYASGPFGKPMNSFANRKHNSGESMPGGLENISESKEEYLWAVQSKISTWPLKQSNFRNSDGECPEKPEYLEYPTHFISS